MSPVYEYMCVKCGHTSMRVRPIDDRKLPTQCDMCGYACKRMISVPAEPRGGDTPKFHRR